MIFNIIVIIFFIISIYFTIKYRFLQLKSPLKAIKIIFKNKNKSSYQTFMMLLASHIGTGNIVGITSALLLGGSGAIFWMWVYAIFSSIFSIIENTLAQVYKTRINGENRGGSAYYIYKGLGYKRISILIAIFFVLTNTIIFQPLQVNTISQTLEIVLKFNKNFIFILLLLFTLIIIFKGTKSIVKFTEYIVPIMSITFILLGLILIFINIKKFPLVLNDIITKAFSKDSILGGCIYVGFKRSLFSHEAGLGTMPTVSAMADCKKPIDQGHVSAFGVFIDTIVMCSVTGFMILLYNIKLDANTEVELIINVFESIFGNIGIFIATFFMLTFAISTFVSEFYLGETNLLFIFRDNAKKIYYFLYKCLFLLGIFLGVYLNNNSIWFIIDVGLILLGCVNLFALFRLENVFKEEVNK